MNRPRLGCFIFHFILMTTACAQAVEITSKIDWEVGQQTLTLVYQNGKWASPQCFSSQGCLALSESIQSKLKKMVVDPGPGGKNPGALKCHQLTQTEVVIAVNPKTRGQQSLCLFQDGSAMATSSL